jgi:hypothetical protein
MTFMKRILVSTAALAVLGAALQAQVGKGLIDPNVASEQQLAGLPNMTPAIAKALVEKRPFMSITDLNTFLLSQKLTKEQAAELYARPSYTSISTRRHATRSCSFPASPRKWRTNSTNTGRGRHGRNSTRRSGSTSARKRPIA